MEINRVFLVVLDGVGCGELPDATDYGDAGSNTLVNTARAIGGSVRTVPGRTWFGPDC